MSAKRSPWDALPKPGLILGERKLWRAEVERTLCALVDPALGSPDRPAYPIDFSMALDLPYGALDSEGIPFNRARATYPAVYHPTTISQYALALWNRALATQSSADDEAFLRQARWLLDHETRLPDGAAGWPLPFPQPGFHAPANWLSALTQGNVLSVLTRAYRLSTDPRYLECARRALQTFEQDILDGGVAAPVGDGVFFEEVAVYPASRILNGFILALFGLYDYVDLVHDDQITQLINQSIATLHTFIEDFDTGYWTRYDLLNQRLASIFYQSLHVTLLEALVQRTGCAHCAALAARWNAYLHSERSRRRYLIESRMSRYRGAIARYLRRAYFGATSAPADQRDRVLIPITAFPFPGGMRSVLGSVAESLKREWRIEYLTGFVGQDTEGLAIHSFARRRGRPALMMPSQFPNIWLYFLRGGWAMRRLIRRTGPYRLILPQDGVATGAFAAITARMAGIRVVSMDHGNVARLSGVEYPLERRKALKTQPLFTRLLDGARLLLYWPSHRILLRQATRHTDAFLVAGDDVAETYRKRLGVPIWKLIRYPYIVDIDHFKPQDERTQAQAREELAIAPGALVVSMVCRLAPEKGLDVALEAFAGALESLPGDLRTRLHLLIGGDGPLRDHLTAEVARRGLREHVRVLGDLNKEAVAKLLSASDVFLYTSTRGGGNPISVLEAMASGCAVIATTQPESLSQQLAEGRGVAVASGEIAAIREAMEGLLTDPVTRSEMGARAREYILRRHSPEALRRNLLRASFFAPPIGAEQNVQSEPSESAPEVNQAPTGAPGEMHAHAATEH
ncbi:MAG TPA: D-glucuronyl C5-epimerase family protein [Ktedonobacterales bacterium]|jgi:glycosyltransferase involved in cell wall biosynthesis